MQNYLRIYVTIAFVSYASYPTIAHTSDFNCGRVDPTAPMTWDYFDPKNHMSTGGVPQGNVKLVENVHLTKKMQSLETGNTGGGISGFLQDVDYTFRRIPNHPKALDMISRFQIRHGGKIPRMGNWVGSWTRSAECYFERAIQFTPREPVLHMLYGIHLHRSGRLTDAEKQYLTSADLSPDSIELHYSIGLLYFELGKFDLAVQHAKKAYEGGYPLPALREKLKKVGKWPAPIDSHNENQ